MIRYKSLLLATALSTAGLLISADIAAAQSTSTQTSAPPKKDENKADEVDSVVVTGSRIRRSTFNSAQPVQVIVADEAALAGVIDTTEMLQDATVAATAGQINNYFTGYVTTGGPGVNTLSLRGLGANRTLILLNGRRFGPAGARGTVGPADLNVIPGGLVERTEILTDGASSIYGSDAVAGVVNIITKQNLDGGQFNFSTNQPQQSGGAEWNFNGSYGRTFTRGYAAIAGQYYQRDALRFKDRDAFRCPQSVVFADPAHLIRADVVDPVTGDYKCTSSSADLVTLYVNGGRGGSIDYSPDSSAIAGGGRLKCDLPGWRQNRVFAIGAGGCALPTAPPSAYTSEEWSATLRDYYARSSTHTPSYESRTAVSPVKRTSITLLGGYDLTADTEVFGELLWNRRESEQDSWQQMFATIVASHPRVPETLRSFRDARGASYAVSHVEPTLLVPSHARQEVEYMRALVAMKGKLSVGRGFDWDLAVQHSRSDATYGSTFIYKDRFAAATSFTTAAQVAAGCNTSLLKTAAACPSGGVDLFSPSVVGGSNLRAEDAAFLLGYETGRTLYDHTYVEGALSGDLFTLPAGPVSFAGGFQWRREKLDDTPGENERASNYQGLSAAGRTAGSDTIKEVFAEFELPLLRNMPLANNLTLNLSSRYSHYKSYGGNATYKASANWSLTPEYRIRASFGTSFRAPALYELYLGNQTSFLEQSSIDPCRSWGTKTDEKLKQNCAAAGIPDDHGRLVSQSALITTGGGRGVLKAETAESLNIGAVWTPTFAKLNVAIDYFKIDVSDEVRQLSSSSIVSGCYTSENYPNDPLCTLFKRNGNTQQRPYEITDVNSSFVNIARQSNEGIDLTARYTREYGFGDITLSARASYILNWEAQLRTDSAVSNMLDRIGNPDWVAVLTAQFKRGDWTAMWGAEIVDSVNNDRFYTSNSGTYLGSTVYFNRSVDTYVEHSVSVRRTMDKWTFVAGITNLFNEGASITSASGGGRGAGNVPLSSQYDYLGRTGFIAVTRSW